ncbi:MAG: hypothetical protein M0002_11270 [Rhodospirillales bacterium]|nr:hypothetical protein [Rhodospirillales bacterium]
MDKQASFASGQWPAFAAGQEERWRMLSAANARLMRGMLTVWQHEMELGQQLMAENFSDPKAISEAFQGGMDVGTQWSAAHRRFEHALTAMRKINDEFYDCLFDVAAMASGGPEGNGAEEAKAPVSMAAPAKEPRAAARSS